MATTTRTREKKETAAKAGRRPAPGALFERGKRLLLPAAAFLAALFAAGAPSSLAVPGGIVFAAGTPDRLLFPGVLGAGLGALLFQRGEAAVRDAGAALILLMLRLTLKKTKGAPKAFHGPLFAFLSVFPAGLASQFGAGTGGAGALLSFACALAALALTPAVRRVWALTDVPGPKLVSPPDVLCFLLSAALPLSALSRVRFGAFSPALPAALLAVLLLGRAGLSFASLAGSAAFGLTLLLTLHDPWALPGLTVGALLFLCVLPFGAVPAAAALAVGAGGLSFFFSGETPVGADLLCVALCGGAVAALPSSLLKKARGDEKGPEETLAGLKLRAAGVALSQLAVSVREGARTQNDPDPDAGVRALRETVCQGCPKLEFCESRLDGELRRALGRAPGQADALPEALDLVCRRKEALLARLEEARRLRALRKLTQKEVRDARLDEAAAFEAAASLLRQTGRTLRAGGKTDPALAALAKRAFGGTKSAPAQVLAETGEAGLAVLHVLRRAPAGELSFEALLSRLERETGRRFCLPGVQTLDGGDLLLTFAEAPPLTPEVAVLQEKAPGERRCGDTVKTFFDGSGSFSCLLSDGMGTGETAALDSRLTATLVSRLLKAGFSPETAVESAGASLRAARPGETLATLDLLQLDLYTGQARFFKAGAAFSMVWAKKRAVVVEGASLPLGILRETKPQETCLTLQRGDAVLLLSDGADGVPKDRIKAAFRDAAGAKELAGAVMETALALGPSLRRDDVTVVAVKLR